MHEQRGQNTHGGQSGDRCRANAHPDDGRDAPAEHDGRNIHALQAFGDVLAHAAFGHNLLENTGPRNNQQNHRYALESFLHGLGNAPHIHAAPDTQDVGGKQHRHQHTETRVGQDFDEGVAGEKLVDARHASQQKHG